MDFEAIICLVESATNEKAEELLIGMAERALIDLRYDNPDLLVRNPDNPKRTPYSLPIALNNAMVFLAEKSDTAYQSGVRKVVADIWLFVLKLAVKTNQSDIGQILKNASVLKNASDLDAVILFEFFERLEKTMINEKN